MWCEKLFSSTSASSWCPEEKRKLCLCAILTPKQFPKSHYVSQVRLFYSATFQRTTSTVWGNEFEEYFWNSFVLSMDMDTNPQAPILYLLPSRAYSLCEVGVKWGWILVPSLGILRWRQQGRGWQSPKPMNLSRVWRSPLQELWSQLNDGQGEVLGAVQVVLLQGTQSHGAQEDSGI